MQATLARTTRAAHEVMTSDARGMSVLRRLAAGLAFFLALQATHPLSPADIVNGLALGALYGVIGVALVLIYRTNRVINFAAAALGALPAITALMLATVKHVNYLLALPVALVGGPLVGALTEILVMRRFSRAPRLIATVVTIGVAQSFAALGFFIPVWFGAKATQVPKVPTPWESLAWHNGRGQPILSGDQVFAFVVVVALAAGLAAFLRYTRVGIALRASAENAERAALLGIPVNRVTAAAWALAGLLSALAIYAQAPLIGVPSDATLGFDALLYGLAAAVVARMDSIGLSLTAGLGIGLLIFASVVATGTNDVASALMLGVILIGLLVQRRVMARALDSGASTWQTVRVFRPVPVELRALPELVRARAVGLCGFAALAVLLPFVVGDANLPTLTVLPLYGIVAVSLVVLTGWAGQISLGQFGLVGIGAAAAGGLAANHNIDFFAALGIGIGAGALAAVLIGLPAIRIQGLYLAVTTLAFGYAMQNYVLNNSFWLGRHLLPTGYTAHLLRPSLYGRIDLENNRTFYYVCVVFLALSLLAATSLRRNRSGRVLIAMRDNQRAATSYAVNPVRTRLSAFAVSGAFAGLAGVLFAYEQHNVIQDSYSVPASIFVFLAASVGGLTSVLSATVGVMLLEAIVLFGPVAWQHLGSDVSAVIPLLLTGPILIVNLYLNPGGLAEVAFAERDKFLRRLAHRHRIHVPALVADGTRDGQLAASAVVTAEAHVEGLDRAGKETAAVTDTAGRTTAAATATRTEPVR